MLHLVWALGSSVSMLRTCGKVHGELCWPKCVGKLGWFNWVGVLCWLELACPTACPCLFKVRPAVVSKTLSHICGK